MRIRFARFALGVALAGAVPGCNPNACTYETRFVATAGSGTSASLGTINVVFFNLRDFSSGVAIPVDLTWQIVSPQETRPPATLSLRDDRNPSAVVVALPAIATTGTSVSASAHHLEATTEREAVFDLLDSGHGILVLTPDGAGTPLVIPLGITAREAWHRPDCS